MDAVHLEHRLDREDLVLVRQVLSLFGLKRNRRRRRGRILEDGLIDEVPVDHQHNVERRAVKFDRASADIDLGRPRRRRSH